jgi:hypothetical protein
MDGWVHLPRFIDKIRLHLAGRLHEDYQPNLGKGFDGLWLETAGVSFEQMVDVVRNSITDGEIYDWVKKIVRKSSEDRDRLREMIFRRGTEGDYKERLKMRKEQSGLQDRADIQCFVDYIDADEGRI